MTAMTREFQDSQIQIYQKAMSEAFWQIPVCTLEIGHDKGSGGNLIFRKTFTHNSSVSSLTHSALHIQAPKTQFKY